MQSVSPRSSDAWFGQAAWIIAAVGGAAGVANASVAASRVPYAAMAFGGSALALLGVLRNRPKPLTPWLLLIAMAVLLGSYEAVLALPQVTDLLPDALEVAGYLCMVFAFERFLHTRRGSADGSVMDVVLMLVGGAALVGQVLAPVAKSPKPGFDRILAGVFPVIDVAAIFLVLLVLFTIRRANTASHFLFGLVGLRFAGDVISALIVTGHAHLSPRVADSLYAMGFGLLAASTLHPAMRDLTQSQPADINSRVGPRRLVLVAIGLCGPAGYAIVEPSKNTADRAVIAGACACLGLGVVHRGWQALMGQQRADARLSALTRQANDLFVVVDPPDFVVRYTATSATTSLADLAPLMRNRPIGEYFGAEIVGRLKDATREDRGGPVEIELHTGGPTNRHVEVTWTRMRHDAFPGSVLIACRDVTERAQAREHVQRSEEHVRELNAALRATLGRLASVEDDERRRVARDLHDTVVQDLVGLRWVVSELASGDGIGDRATDLEALSERLATLTETTRRVSHRLASPIVDAATLDTALRHEVAALRSTQLAIDLKCTLDCAVDAATAALTFRTAREALRNVVQHSEARNVSVIVSTRASRLEAALRDDGIGVDPAVLAAQLRAGHIGVASMRDSVIAAGGTFAITSVPTGGTEVQFSLPLRDDLARAVAGDGCERTPIG